MWQKLAFTLLVVSFGIPSVSAAQEVRPFVECANLERRGQAHTIVYFGYINTGPDAVTLPAGTGSNFFLPTPADEGQPSVFEPGEHHFAFIAYRLGGSNNIWTLQGHKVIADATSLPCPSYLFYRGDWVAGTFYADGDVVSFGGRYYQGINRDANAFRPFVQSQTLTPEENPNEWQAFSPTTYPVMNLPGSGNSGTSVILSTAVYTFPRTGRLTIADPRITATSVVEVEYVGGSLVPGLAINVDAGTFTAIGLPGKQFRYLLIR